MEFKVRINNADGLFAVLADGIILPVGGRNFYANNHRRAPVHSHLLYLTRLERH